MTIKDLKDLKKLVKLCRDTGIDAIKIDGIEFALGRAPQPTKIVQSYQAPSHALLPNGITEDTKIEIEELTEEQMMMWSSQGSIEEQQ